MNISALFLRTGLALCLAAPITYAADVTWGTPQQISGVTDVSTTGTLVGAFNVGPGPGVPPTTVNGVTFQSFNAPGGAGTSGNFTMTPGGGGVFGSNTDGASSMAPFTNLNSNYQTLLASYVVPLFDPITLTISGLVAGTQYQFEFWNNKSSDMFSYGITATGGNNSVTTRSNDGHADGGLGEWITGAFTADAITQSFRFLGDGDGGFLNAFQLRQIPTGNAVPESGSTLGFLALGLTGLLLVLPRFRDRRTL